jgi:ribosome-associated toxin RatA of RatAB toxin-antitoxin module
MIYFSHSQKLNFPLKQFYRTITKVKNYKNFLPWCIDSYEKDHKIYNLTYMEIQNKFPELTKNIIISSYLNKRYNKLGENHTENKDNNNLINLKTYEGFIKVGFDLVEFSYLSKVYTISENIVLSITDDSQSHIFSKLESVWILEDDINIKKIEDFEKINIDYNIQFEMKSILFSKITSLFMSFLGENIVKSFISQTEKMIKEENENYLSENLDNKNNNCKENEIIRKKKLDNLIKNLDEFLYKENFEIDLNLDLELDNYHDFNTNKSSEKIKNLFYYLIKENILSLEELETLVKKTKLNISTKFQFLHYIDIYDLNNSNQINYIGKDLKNFV